MYRCLTQDVLKSLWMVIYFFGYSCNLFKGLDLSLEFAGSSAPESGSVTVQQNLLSASWIGSNVQ